MASSYSEFSTMLNCCGKFWAVVSFLAASAASSGFFLPYWLEGYLDQNNSTAFLGTFRRCGYLRTAKNKLEIVEECGRYSTFMDIPNFWWRCSTILIGTGCGLALIAAFIILFSCCLRDVFSSGSARILGAVQFVAGIFLGGGMAIYVYGWKDNADVIQVCGEDATAFDLGRCSFAWAFYLTASGSGLVLLSSFFSCCAIRDPGFTKLKDMNRIENRRLV